MTLLEQYLTSLLQIRGTGAAVPETSYYGALEVLLDGVGAQLKPRVHCVINLANRGAGIPDGGFFSRDQVQRGDQTPLPGAMPSRGALEVKSPSADVLAVAKSAQVQQYLGLYGQVLVSNLRDFVVVENGGGGGPRLGERYTLAADEAAFWHFAASGERGRAEASSRFEDYLKRVLLRRAPLSAPADVAWYLASYAREAKARIDASRLDRLAGLRVALEQALGMTFEGPEGERFFRATLVQTLFYGVFSAWVMWVRGNPAPDERFDWAAAGRTLHVPMLQRLYEHLAGYGTLGPLGLTEILDWTTEVLDRVDRAAFFAEFDAEQAVQYFYEPFLAAYDPQLRKELGVWYTPQEIVDYQVERVDRVLREELGVRAGLADPLVHVLDPCCGTGAYLVAVLRRIDRTLRERGEEALVGQELRQAVQSRIHGFEILPAPFVVAHLQLGLLLTELGAPLSPKERAGVYLTNSLTGWAASTEPRQPSLWPELQEEADAAAEVKREAPILVVLGNPPYNAFAGISPEEEGGLVEPYKTGLAETWGVKKYNLDDLYVRFFRLAERRIAATGRGVVCYISNFSYLGDPSFVAMRQELLRSFDLLWFDSLNGDSRRTGKLTPWGAPDPSVFSTTLNRAGIRVGTAVSLLVRASNRRPRADVRLREFWGTTKGADLLATTVSPESLEDGHPYVVVQPEPATRLSFRPAAVSADYRRWPSVAELAAEEPYCGLLEKRGGALIDIDRTALVDRMKAYYDRDLEWAELAALGHGYTQDWARFDARMARERVLAVEQFSQDAIKPWLQTAMDHRWCYTSLVRPLWNEPRPTYLPNVFPGNASFVSRKQRVAQIEGYPAYLTSALGNDQAVRTHAYYAPMLLVTAQTGPGGQTSLDFGDSPHGSRTGLATRANLSAAARRWLTKLGAPEPDRCDATAAAPWLHALAVTYTPAYLAEQEDGLRGDWPRVPLPNSLATLNESARLGRQLAGLLEPEAQVPGGAADALPLIDWVAVPRAVAGGQLRAEDLELTAGWGGAGQGGVVMPRRGRAEVRAYSVEERAALALTAREYELDEETACELLGATVVDVYLNDAAYWGAIPSTVWEMCIGGYQVLKKWLSYRELPLLGRALLTAEMREFTSMARRLSAILLLGPRLDANYRAIERDYYDFTMNP
ncbi:MAG TPA: DNA methyltransferase [Armatimonadetes bacterium]|nr:DNA methyltransferase [Armatimonadota bacterium]